MADGGDLRLGILGSLAAWRDGSALLLGGSKQRAVLTLLAVERGRTVSTDALIEALWPEKTPGRPQTAIQGYVSHLRKVLGPETIATDASGYRLDVLAEALDAAEFECRLGSAPGLAPAARAVDLAGALALWRGPALADFAYESWAQAEIARLEELRLVALEARLTADLECGRGAELVGEIEALVREHPLRERLRGQLMLALYRAGRQAEALDAYTAARAALVDELGIDPGSELQALHRSILNQDEELAGQAPVVPTVSVPLPATPIVGRKREHEQIVLRLRDRGSRLLTVTGPGGIGKTRLAIEAARNVADAFPDGVWFVELASLTEPEHVLPAIATAIGAAGDIVEHVGTQRLLLVLDNFEQVVAGAAELGPILSGCANLAVLVTSRERLHLAGELELPLEPLAPESAAELFADRAARLGVHVDVDGGDVADLCERLDWLPLAIELVAARVKLFTPGDLLSRLGTRLELATAAPQDFPQRHRMLAATIEWSHALLNDAGRDMFEGLAVFVGPFDVADVEAVLSGDLDTLAALVDKSLVMRRPDAHGRFAMLATIREFALGRLEARADVSELRRRHAEHVLAEVARADELLAGPDQASGFEAIARRRDDLRAALDWAEETDAGLALALVVAAGWFWYVRGHLAEGRTRLETALGLAGEQDTALRATACMRAGAIADAQVDLPAAERFYREALDIRRRLGDTPGTYGPLNNLGNLALQAGDYAAARRAHEDGLALARELGDGEAIGSALHNLALVYLVDEDEEGAVPLLEEGLEFAEAVGNTYGAANCHANLGAALVARGEHARAAEHLAESVRLLRELDATEVMAPALEDLAALALATGDASGAARRLGAAVSLRTAVGARAGRADADRAARTERRARLKLGDEAFEREWQECQRLSLDEVVELAEREASTPIASAPG